MKYYLVAGEASGDLHGANLMKALKTLDSYADFHYFGGDKMQAEGGTLVKHFAEMAFMGFAEVIFNLRTILNNLNQCRKDILTYQPDVLILIDFPGFNLRIAEFAKKNNIKVSYYISPKVWAWNQKRVLKIKKVVDKMYCILPFEVDFYKSRGIEVEYIGNPLLDAIHDFQPDPDFVNNNHLDPDRPIIAILPGSRIQEVKRILPAVFGKPGHLFETNPLTQNFADYQFVIAGISGLPKNLYESYRYLSGVTIVYDQTYDLLQYAYAAIVTSGTATLETALFKVPQVVVYRGAPISIAIARLLIKIRFISLANLIMDRKVVEELIQKDCNPQRIIKELKQITSGPQRQRILDDYNLLAEKVGKPGASERAAQSIITFATN